MKYDFMKICIFLRIYKIVLIYIVNYVGKIVNYWFLRLVYMYIYYWNLIFNKFVMWIFRYVI